MQRRQIIVHKAGFIRVQASKVPRLGPFKITGGVVFFRGEKNRRDVNEREKPRAHDHHSCFFVAPERGYFKRIFHRQIAVHTQHHQYVHGRALAKVRNSEVDLAQKRAEQPFLVDHRTQKKRYEENVEKVAYGQVKEIKVGNG